MSLIKALAFRKVSPDNPLPNEILVSNDMVYVGLYPRIFASDSMIGHYYEFFVGSFERATGLQLWEGLLQVGDPAEANGTLLPLVCISHFVVFANTIYRFQAEVELPPASIDTLTVENHALFSQFPVQ